jgi:hypothetical protein
MLHKLQSELVWKGYRLLVTEVYVCFYWLKCENYGHALKFEALFYENTILRSHDNDSPTLKGHKEIIKSVMSDCMCTT